RLVTEIQDNGELVGRLFLRFLGRPGKPDELNGAIDMFQQLEQDHVKLIAELEAYSQKLAPKLARHELERQGRVATLQAEIEAHREIMKFRRPRVEQERQQRVAKAQAALADYDKKLAANLPDWEASQSGVTRWHVLEPVEMSGMYRARFARQADGSVFVEGDNVKGAYRIAAPIPLERMTGIRLEALADQRLPNRGPGRSGDGNFVVTEFAARSLAAAGPLKLVRSWDFSGADENWQTDDAAKVVADSGTCYVFGNSQGAGVTTSFTEPAGSYLLEVVTGIRSAVTFRVQWATAKQPTFDDARSARRTLLAGSGGRLPTPIAIAADSELTGLRIVVEDDGGMLPIDAVRLFAAEEGSYADVTLQNATATFSQGAYPVASAIDGNSTADSGNGWAIAPQTGRDHAAAFELAAPLEAAENRLLELTIHQQFGDGQHSLGRFRLSVTDAAQPLNYGLPPEITTILAKPADQRSDADREVLLAQVRKDDKRYKKLQTKLAAEQQPLPEDPRLKELDAELAKAQQPLPVDPKLQQLRRAIALSEEQLKNKRLTVAQDIVWALINSPSFLYNH
ncbi:MAG: hypothetical protein WD229_15775, partial [Pirellulales bacterium]